MLVWCLKQVEELIFKCLTSGSFIAGRISGIVKEFVRLSQDLFSIFILIH